MSDYQEITESEWKKSLLIIVPLVIIIAVGAFFLLPDYWHIWAALVTVTVIVVIIIAAREAKDVVFKCPKCGQEFTVSAFKSVMAPHGVTKKDGKWYEWKHLECPMCHEKTKMYPVDTG
ncbi:MAG: hypothetical protein HXS44_00920 [Theionarchaea archaeon]|nr:hypothetical protein [Theionarchaea archaeon]